MNDYKQLIPTQEFVKNFPQKIKHLANYYSLPDSPKISYRTFRYYMTKKLMPKAPIIGKKSHYYDAPELYARLFMVWYLTHFGKATVEQIRDILNSVKSKKLLECIQLFLNDEGFMDGVLEGIDFERESEESFLPYIQDAIEYAAEYKSELIFKILDYLIEGKMMNLTRLNGELSDIRKERALYRKSIHRLPKPKYLPRVINHEIKDYIKTKSELKGLKAHTQKSLKNIEETLRESRQTLKMIKKMPARTK